MERRRGARTPKGGRVTLLALIVAAALGCSAWALTTTADAYLYWATGDNTIGRQANDGSHVNTGFIQGAYAPYGVAVDSGYVYWTNSSNGSVGRANIDGSGANQSFITGGDTSTGIAVDGSHIYWANAGTSGGGSIDSIARADLNGGSVNQSFIPVAAAARPYGVAVNGSYIYWSDANGTIQRASLNGTGKVTLVTLPSGHGASQITLDGSYIYWADSEGNQIGRANLDGTNQIDSFVTAGSVPWGVAVDSQFLYWVNHSAYAGQCGPSLGGSGTIGRSTLSGTNAMQSWQNCTGSSPRFLALDELSPNPTPGPNPGPTSGPGSGTGSGSGSPTPGPGTGSSTHCIVPKLKGKTLKAAKKALRGAHCSLGKVTKRHSSRKNRGHILGTNPGAGAKLASGAAVKLTVGK